MQKLNPNDPETMSTNLVSENIERVRSLFPEAIVEGKIDFEVLKQLLGDSVDEREEKYGLNWHGKRKARQLALTPSTGTLRPCPEDSVDWDTTQNLMIEGDNLEVLKLLEKSYAGKVKLIYIDPPYNTGNDFVYADDFTDNLKNYLEQTRQLEDGIGTSSNTEASGRFHTDWLNMIYPRLKISKQLLRSDGIIVVSIDGRELKNLLSVMDEIYGEENFLECAVLKNKAGAGAKPKAFITVHEYLVCYARDASFIKGMSLPMTPEQAALYNKTDEHVAIRGPYGTWALATTSMGDRPNLRFPIIHEGEEIWPEKQWLWSRERVAEAQLKNELVFNRKSDGLWSVRFKRYLNDDDGSENLSTPTSFWDGPYTHAGTKDIDSLFEERVFTFPKPVELITKWLSMNFGTSSSEPQLILDFFAGSGTTGHAVMAQNAVDGGNRRFILVQLPERLDPEKSEQKVAANFCEKLGKPRNIAELTKERLRRAGKKVKTDSPLFAGDLGFRVFKLDTSNIAPWDTESENLNESLLAAVSNIKEDRTEADILNELLIKLGLDICVPLEEREIAGKTVHSVGAGALMVCLDSRIDRSEVESLAQGIVAWHKELDPAAVSSMVFLDSAFADDVSKTNMTAILGQHGLLKVRSL